MEANRHNHITATYHLINKKNQRNQYMRDTFSTHKKIEAADSKRDRMQSQGAPKPKLNTIDLNQVKPPARKIVDNELNQTMPISIHSTKAKAEGIDMTGPTREVATEEFNGRRAATLDARPEETSDFVDPAAQTQTGRWADSNKVDMLRTRAVKQSQSPDKY